MPKRKRVSNINIEALRAKLVGPRKRQRTKRGERARCARDRLIAIADRLERLLDRQNT